MTGDSTAESDVWVSGGTWRDSKEWWSSLKAAAKTAVMAETLCHWPLGWGCVLLCRAVARSRCNRNTSGTCYTWHSCCGRQSHQGSLSLESSCWRRGWQCCLRALCAAAPLCSAYAGPPHPACCRAPPHHGLVGCWAPAHTHLMNICTVILSWYLSSY